MNTDFYLILLLLLVAKRPIIAENQYDELQHNLYYTD